ncbi:hypothetical protein M758_11G095600 [Ceratodon purpureus]|nr:hypothetical protein M758_11G095600 [Ceratodon purpureus]
MWITACSLLKPRFRSHTRFREPHQHIQHLQHLQHREYHRSDQCRLGSFRGSGGDV